LTGQPGSCPARAHGPRVSVVSVRVSHFSDGASRTQPPKGSSPKTAASASLSLLGTLGLKLDLAQAALGRSVRHSHLRGVSSKARWTIRGGRRLRSGASTRTAIRYGVGSCWGTSSIWGPFQTMSLVGSRVRSSSARHKKLSLPTLPRLGWRMMLHRSRP
jgi:hypothetical protein